MKSESVTKAWEVARDTILRGYRKPISKAMHELDEHVAILEAENAKLRGLVLDYYNAPCLECNPWSESWESCKHCESGNCTLATRTLELGIEVDG